MTDSHLVRSRNRGGGLGQWLAVLGASVAIGVAIALVVSWPHTGGGTLSLSKTPPSSPREVASSVTAAPHPAPVAGTPAAKRDERVHTCDPIFGGGAPHRVTTSATRAAPASCDAAHAVLLAALNAGSASVGDWHCVSRPNQRTLEACMSSGGRRIAARD